MKKKLNVKQKSQIRGAQAGIRLPYVYNFPTAKK